MTENNSTEAHLKRLVDNLAHDLRTPLTTICLGVENVQRSVAAFKNGQTLTPRKAQMLTLVTDNADLAAQMANHYLDMLQAQLCDFTSASITTFNRYSMADAVKQAVSAYPMPKSMREQIKLELDEDFIFSGNHILMEHIFFNMIKNALYALQAAGGGEITIRLQRHARENKVIVHDTGVGITRTDMSHIFEPFFSTRESANGLGLTFCKKAMTLHKGNVLCNSAPEKFTEFTLLFPTAKT